MKEMDTYERYQRQILLNDFGMAGQQKLIQAKVLVAGAGGLGCPALLYLAAAGVGTIGIVDDDTVALHNLHRQVLYTVNDIGSSKAEKAAGVLQKLNPEINILTWRQRLTVDNALEILDGFDIVIDGTDNFATRYLINDACVLTGKPLVYAAISQFEGQVAVFNHPGEGTEDPVNYRDLFPQPPHEDEVLNCAEAGVLGVLPGIIGTMQANEAIKLIAGIGTPLVNRLLTFNALTNQFFELDLSAREDTRALIPADATAFRQMNYEWLCASTHRMPELDAGELDKLLATKVVDVIDVREPTEKPEVHEFAHLKIPLQQIADSTQAMQSDTVVVFCQSGKRSQQAARVLSGIFGTSKKVYSLKGGIVEWKKQHERE
jgi:adenylyltransferase/sulfurtransferase